MHISVELGQISKEHYQWKQNKMPLDTIPDLSATNHVICPTGREGLTTMPENKLELAHLSGS